MSMMINPHRFAVAAGAFSPLSLTGLNRWYDPSDAGTVTLDASNNVTQLNDKSGNGFHVTTGNSGPALRLEGGRNALDCNGTTANRLFSGTGPGTGVAAAFGGSDKPLALFAIVRSDDAAPSHEGRFIGISSSSDTDPFHLFGLTASATGWMGTRRDDTRALTKTVSTGVAADTDLHLVTYLFDGTQMTIRVDGVALVTNGDVDVNTMTVDCFTIGCFRGGAGGFFTPWDGAVGELFLLTAVPGATDLANAESYLAGRWGITI